MILNKKQKEQVALQLKAHNHSNYKTNIEIVGGFILKDFVVYKNVLRPEIMSSLQLAQFLCLSNGLYKNKSVLDLGCGTGIQGIVMALCGAKKVICSDIATDAVSNTDQNIKNYKLSKKMKVVRGDLFDGIKLQKFDVIIFNHQFFSDGSMEEQLTVDFKNIKRGSLIHNFFEEAKKFLNTGGVVFMNYLHLAGPINNPAIQAPKHGYKVIERYNMDVKIGLQRGSVSIYEIRL